MPSEAKDLLLSEPIQRFAEVVREAAVKEKPLRLRGGGTKDFYGQSLEGEVLDTRSCAGITAYDPSELVDRKSTRLNSSHVQPSRMPSSA